MDIHRKCPNSNYVPEKALKPFSDLPYPPFSHFTRQGIVPDPSSAEHEAIVNDITCGKDRILDAEDKICRLHQERVRMKEEVFKRESIFAPIRRLPANILGEIFRTVGTVTVWKSYHLPIVPPVSHVCYVWRSVSVELSELWSNITISGCNPWVTPHRAVMEAFITRSKERPLTFELFGYPGQNTNDHGFRFMVDFIISHSRRWKHIVLNIPTTAHARFILARNAVPLLESVSLIGKQPGLLNWFENAPALRSLSLEDVPLPSIRCPWNQITLLRLSESLMINTSLYVTPTQASNLQGLDLGTCVLPGRVQPPMEIEPHQMVELPHLKKLSVQSYFSENIAPILSMISATSLEELIITDNGGDNNREIVGCVISLINRSMATERLTVTLGDKKSITEALTRILFEISGANAALQFEKHECAALFLMEFANRTSRLTLPGSARIYNPFRIRSLEYRETIEELIPTLKNPDLFIEKVFVLNEYPQRWVKLSFQRFLGFSQAYGRKLCEGEIQLVNFD